MIIATLILLAACVEDPPAAEALEPEVVCSHPSSIFEAQMEVSYPDYADVGSVEFILEQEGEFWTTWLQAPDEDNVYWHTKMQIMEFDCNVEYFYDFIEAGEE